MNVECTICTRTASNFHNNGLCSSCNDRPQRRKELTQLKTCKHCKTQIATDYNENTKQYIEAHKQDGLCPDCRQNPNRTLPQQPQKLAITALTNITKNVQQTLIPGENATQTTVIQKTNNKQFNLAEILDALNTDFTFKTPDDTKELWYYNNGTYQPAEPIIETLLETVLQEKLTSHQTREILGHLKRSSYITREQINNTTEHIPLQNGVLNLKTLELQEHCTDKVFTYKLSTIYDPQADCPKFKQWLSEVQTSENIQILQEYAGYTLLPDMPFHKALLLIGEGRNGKTTYLKTIEHIIGTTNTSHIDLQDFISDNRFILADLYGKLANISSEPETKKVLQTSVFKKITGGDTISAELKNQQKRLNFINHAKLYFSGNSYPRTLDSTTAFKQRIILIKWEKQFLENQGQIQNIEHNWTKNQQETSGILNWMIQGLQRLLQNSKFSTSQTQDQTMIEYERGSDSISAWLHERIEFNPKRYLDRETAYNDYVTYCNYHEIYTADKNKFNGKLRNTPKITDSFKRVLKKSIRVWNGIELKQTPLEQENTLDSLIEEQKTLENSQNDTGDTTDTAISHSKQNELEQFEQENAVSLVSLVSLNEPQTNASDVTQLESPISPSPQAKTSQNNSNNKLFEREMPGAGWGTGENPPPVASSSVIVCFFCGAKVQAEEVLEGDVSFGNPAHKICYRYHERQQLQVKQSQIVYHYARVPPGEQCRQCENYCVEYTLKMSNDSGKPERLCECCFNMRRRTFVDAQWIDKTEASTVG